MSRKTNKLRGRLAVEAQRAKRLKAEAAKLKAESLRLALWQARLEREQKDLNRSVALRVRVERDFLEPRGETFALRVTFYPRELAYTRFGGTQLQNASYLAAMEGDKIGKQVSEVLLRCLTGELEEFTKAR